jgi:hypothetical protein
MSYETYYDRYKELCTTYKIKHGTYGLIPDEQLKTLSAIDVQKALEEAIKEYDVVVASAGSGYAHIKYKVLRNAPGLSIKDLAIICDQGNLCFGYRTEGTLICVHTD